MSTDIEKKTTWQEEAYRDAGMQESSAMAELPIIKVYNKPMGNGIEDISKTGKIIIKRNGGDWEVLGDEVKLNVLLVRKFYTGFVPRINDFGNIQKDSKGNIIKDFYYTPEVDVFNKDHIALGMQPKGGKKTIIGKASKQDFDEYCKQTKIDGVINPLFKEIKTNQQTGERYPISYMKLGYVIYAEDLDTKEIYKIIPGGSYGRFNDIKDGTFEHLKLQATNDYKELNGTSPLLSFIETKVSVKHEDGFNYLDWKLAGFIVNDNRNRVEEVTNLVNEFNKERFVGIDFDKPLEKIAYNRNLALEAPKESTGNSTEEDE